MRRIVRVILGFFAVEGLVVGGWQLLAPRSFWTDFPGLGRHWSAATAPTTSTCSATSASAPSPSAWSR